jgi:terminase small subunit / prophage DNA-packing protein
MTETKTMTTSDLSDLFGLSQRAVRDLSARGIITPVRRGRFELAASVRGYVEHLRSVASGRGGEVAVLELSAERAKLAHEQTIGHQLKNAALRRELVEADQVRSEWATLLRTIRAGMLAVPSRCQQRLAHLTAADVAVIDREVRDALTETAKNDDD